MISKLIPIEPKDVWRKEANKLTLWLGSNFDCLEDQLGIELNLIELNKFTGNYYGDISARDSSNHKVYASYLYNRFTLLKDFLMLFLEKYLTLSLTSVSILFSEV